MREDKKNPAKYLKDDDNFGSEVANLITEARIYVGYSQHELSKLINTKQPSIARWEAALSLPSLRSLKKIADALNTYLIPPKFGFMEEYEVKQKTDHAEIHKIDWPVNKVAEYQASTENISLNLLISSYRNAKWTR